MHKHKNTEKFFGLNLVKKRVVAVNILAICTSCPDTISYCRKSSKTAFRRQQNDTNSKSMYGRIGMSKRLFSLDVFSRLQRRLVLCAKRTCLHFKQAFFAMQNKLVCNPPLAQARHRRKRNSHKALCINAMWGFLPERKKPHIIYISKCKTKVSPKICPPDCSRWHRL